MPIRAKITGGTSEDPPRADMSVVGNIDQYKRVAHRYLSQRPIWIGHVKFSIAWLGHTRGKKLCLRNKRQIARTGQRLLSA
jgi:hypothetical protein